LDPNGAYFIRDKEAYDMRYANIHNPEWYIQQKIMNNEEGYFDFSKNMIDIGACYGTYSMILPFNHIFMFEPNKEFFAYCQANMLLHNKIYHADLFNVAVSNETGFIEFDGFTGGDLSVDYNTWMDTHKAKVPCIKLDDMQDRLVNIGFIKIDIEGMEPYAIMGAKQVIKNNNYPPILFESWARNMDVNSNHDKESEEHYVKRVSLLNEVLSELGYTVINEWGDNINHLAVHLNK
jgi:FkbM family methyltransferase